MRASTLRLVFLLAIAGAVAFQVGRHRVSVGLGVEETVCGDRSLRLSWSGVRPDTACPFGGHVNWKPGLLAPRVLDVQWHAIDLEK